MTTKRRQLVGTLSARLEVLFAMGMSQRLYRGTRKYSHLGTLGTSHRYFGYLGYCEYPTTQLTTVHLQPDLAAMGIAELRQLCHRVL